MTEAIHLGKPYLAMPMGGQFEQELNAILLADLAYGKNGREMTGESIGDFLYHLPEYKDRLGQYVGEDNHRIEAKLDDLLADDCALAREFHLRRA